ncbi:MAG: hypothetical protein Tsb0034_16470 [Ekhidna sp.]
MKKTLTLSLMLLGCICYSQEQFYKTWYIMDPGDDISRQRLTISADGILIERYEDYEVEEPYWEVDRENPFSETRIKGDRYQIVGYSEEDKAYFGGEFFLSENEGELKGYQMREPLKSAEEAFKKLDENPYKEMLAKTFYTQSRLEEINEMPPLVEITKEDLITTIKYVQSFGPLMTDFMNEQNDPRMRFVITRAAKNLRTQKFIDLGYNPFIYTEEWYMDKFKDDPDIKKLNEMSEYVKF